MREYSVLCVWIVTGLYFSVGKKKKLNLENDNKELIKTKHAGGGSFE